MHSTGLGTFVALLMIAAPLSAHRTPPTQASSRVVPAAARGPAATVDAFHAALKRGDTRAAATLMAEDALIFESGEAERTKAEYAAHHLPADAEFARSVSSVVTHRAAHSNGAVAWIASEGRTTGSYKGKPIDLLTTETMILRRVGRSWRITHVHWSSTRSG